MRAGSAALCEGTVWHKRNRPAEHQFTYRVSHVWIDPDRPEDLTNNHRLWSATRRAPARFRRSDYGLSEHGFLSEEVRTSLTPVLGYRPEGPIRMLSQIRRWGWLFNPITLFVAWHTDADRPVGAVCEVTNTPWKERTQYPVPLTSSDGIHWTSEFDKELHVSPFLGMDFGYRLTLTDRQPALGVRIDVLDRTVAGEPIVETALAVERSSPCRAALGRALVRGALSTRTVSLAIHFQAARLVAKRVRFVPHPKKRKHSPVQKGTP